MKDLFLVFCALVHNTYLNYKPPLKQFLLMQMQSNIRDASDDKHYHHLEYQFKKSTDLIRTIFNKKITSH